MCGCLIVACGCATDGPYQYGRFHPDRSEGIDPEPVVVEYGKPHKTLDRMANILGTPAKILRLNSKVDNHHISDETLEKLITYLEKNDITDVCVDVNHYAPREQWRRLRENKRIAPGWKYTAGTLSWVRYTVLPGRVFGGTGYNAFTNSLYVNSDVPAMLLFEAAYAKDIHSQKHPGFYAVIVNDFPGVKVWRQTRAVKDVVGYAKQENDWEIEKETYKVMYAHLGSEAVGGFGILLTGPTSSGSNLLVGPLLGLGGAIAGHAVGHSVAREREAELEKLKPDQEREDGSVVQAQYGSQVESESDEGQPLKRASYHTKSDDDDRPTNDVEDEDVGRSNPD
ncbi:hypothetical protein [Schlesneria paludicola]|uniref:hypothetical protein n=1 Tax=Schlesneria paludicola TaxID=360056 RepID=UPI0012FB1925|nr:hypothetical protein [Schlesneria paludicola]